ncbi:MAG: phosphoadenylyl-sulfate reductase [Hyphomicrobiaceae bacterium]|nr:phosphoadenylyl-sulfate reductase [Hyphomicrobiaceae bacterium]
MVIVDLKSGALGDASGAGLVELGSAADVEARRAAIETAAETGAAIGLRFGKFNDGRGFTQARLLRTAHGYTGRLLAVGHLVPDQALHLFRAGFDAVEIHEARRHGEWQDALAAYRGAYQSALRNPLALRRDASRRKAEAVAATIGAVTSLEDRIRAIRASVPGRIVFSTSLGIEDQAITHAIATTGVDIDLVTLDTGRHFAETLDTLAFTEARYSLRIRVMAPERDDVEALVARDGAFGFRTSIEARKACCEVRKVVPLRRALDGAQGWITGLRRDQSGGRGSVPFAEWDETYGLVKASPIADWSLATLEAYVALNDVPINPLHRQGFPSIGCQPCTRAIKPGEPIRAGRWWWESEDGKECGLHNRPQAIGAAA